MATVIVNVSGTYTASGEGTVFKFGESGWDVVLEGTSSLDGLDFTGYTDGDYAIGDYGRAGNDFWFDYRKYDDYNDTETVIGKVTVKNYFASADKVEQLSYYDVGSDKTAVFFIRVGEDGDFHHNLIIGLTGTDSTTLHGDEGNDMLIGTENADTLYGDAGEDKLEGGGGNDILYGGAGSDVLEGGEGSDRLYGEADDDRLYAGSGKDYLYGGDGNDNLDGGQGDDRLYGQAGNDTLFGGTGSDVFYYAKGEGHDTIADYTEGKDLVFVNSGLISKTTANNGTLKFTIEKGSITLQNNAANQVISLKDKRGNYTASADSIVLESNFKGTMDSSTFLATVGTIDGSAATEAVKLNGNNNDNVITGGSGNDTLTGGGGKDTLVGGAGDDYLYGGQGDDTLTGGAGKDTFAYGKGQGNDVVKDYKKGEDVIEITKGGISKTTVNENNDLVYTIGDGSLTLRNVGTKAVSIKDTQGSYQASGTNIVLNEDYTGTINAAQFYTGVTAVKGQATTTDVVIKGNANGNELYGGSGNNEMYGEKGDDTVYGYAGDDTLYGGAGSDKLYGGDGNDTLYGDSGNDKLYGGAGDDTLNGGSGKDKLYSDGGNDTLIGGVGSDVYVLQSAFTSDTNISVDQTGYKSGDADELLLRKLNKDDATFALDGGVLTITDKNTGGKVTVSGWDVNPLAAITFADGIASGITVNVSGNNQTIYGSGSHDDITLKSGSDNKIYGNSGYDIITINGSETTTQRNKIYGGAGNDIIHLGAGQNNKIYGEAGDDTIRLWSGMGNGNEVYGGDGADTIFSNENIGGVTVDGGSGMDTITIRSGGAHPTVSGGAHSDTITVYGDGFTVNGDEGDDTIRLVEISGATANGGTGNDTISVEGAYDSNTICGGEGSDTFVITHAYDSTVYIDQSVYAAGDEDNLELRFWNRLDSEPNLSDIYLNENGDMEINLSACSIEGMEFSVGIYIIGWADNPLHSVSYFTDSGQVTINTSGFTEAGQHYSLLA